MRKVSKKRYEELIPFARQFSRDPSFISYLDFLEDISRDALEKRILNADFESSDFNTVLRFRAYIDRIVGASNE